MATTPRPLIAIAAIYIASEIGLILLKPNLMGFARLAIYTFVLHFVVSGSRTATKLWAFLSIIGGYRIALTALERNLPTEFGTAIALAAFAAFLFLSAAYCLFSREVKDFQEGKVV